MPLTSCAQTSGSTSTSLLDQVRARNAGAWERLARLYGPLVYGWARRQGLQDADAADVAQEVFSAVAAGIAGFHRAANDSFRGWLWGITRNKIADHFRRRATRPIAAGGSDAAAQWLQVPEALPDASSSAPFHADAILLRRALEVLRAEFEPRTWQAVWRATIDGHRAADIAVDLGMSPRAVRQAKYRVLHRLRIELGEK
jgi:RNA polymerase sigma-70 factor (ECF subfamily)